MERLTNEDFESLINEHSQMLFKIAYSYTKNTFDSQDIVQEVFVKFYRVRNSFENEEHIKNWLIRVTINKSLNALKQNKKELLVGGEYINNLSETSEVDEKNEEIRECVLALKDSYKTVIILYYYDNYSIKEIASFLKISENNVKVRLNRARVKLKEIIYERKDKNGKR